MDPAKVVMHEVQGHRMVEVRHLLAETVSSSLSMAILSSAHTTCVRSSPNIPVPSRSLSVLSRTPEIRHEILPLPPSAMGRPS